MKLVNMNFNFYATPGTRQRRSADGSLLGGLSVQIITYYRKNSDEAIDDLERNLAAATEKVAKNDGQVIPANFEAQVKSQSATVAPNEEIPDYLDFGTLNEKNRCPTDSCWTYHPETGTCRLREGCTDVECTSTSIIAAG